MRSLPRLPLLWLLAGGVIQAQDITFTVDATQDRHVIPEVVYGSNELGYASTVVRHGGNRHTGWNWENNASNAGNDYIHNSDSYLGSNAGIGSSTTPGHLLEAWVNADRAAGQKSLITLPLAGYVAADMAGPVSDAQKAPSSRWKAVVAKKGSAFTLTPSSTDGSVYLDEMANFNVTKFGSGAGGGVHAYNLDNEPGLWPETHSRLHPAAPTYTEMLSKSTAAASAVLAVDPSAEIYGPTLYGWSDYIQLQSAPDAGTYNPTYGSFAGYYLNGFKNASTTAGRRLLHRFDLHWYPEATGDSRIVFANGGSEGTANDIEARLQAPRSLWDPTYTEKSWIAQDYLRAPIRLLPRMQELIAQYYPGTGLAMTEYSYGGAAHISGGVAQADVLGILGEYSVAANYWPLFADNSYVKAAFQMYRNYDGAGTTYGNVSLAATASNNALGAVHAARKGVGGATLTVVAINRSRTVSQTARVQFTLPSGQSISGVKAWRLAGTTPQVIAATAPTVSGAGFTQALPALSATLYEVKLSSTAYTYTSWQQQTFGAQAGDPAISGPTADPDRDGLSNLLEYTGGRDPLVGDRTPLLAVVPAAPGQLRLTFTRRISITDVQVTLQSSPILTAPTWTERDPATLNPTRVAIDANTEQWTITLPTTGAATQFYKLKVQAASSAAAAPVVQSVSRSSRVRAVRRAALR